MLSPFPRTRWTLVRLARLIAAACLPTAAWQMPWRPAVVQGRSMEPTIASGSLWLYDRRYYRTHDVRRGDIVLLRMGVETWVKRVYAVGGTSFWGLQDRSDPESRVDPIDPRQLRRFRHMAARLRARRRAFAVVRVRVPRGQLFVVGDGPWSIDSRQVGPLPASRLLGRLMASPRGDDPAALAELAFPNRRGPRVGARRA